MSGTTQSPDAGGSAPTPWPEAEQLAFLTGAAFLGRLRLLASEHGFKASVARVDAAHHRPGAGVSVVVELVGEGRSVFLGASTQRLPDGIAPFVVEADGDRISVWIHPMDPLLPGLASASVPGEVERRWGGGRPVTELETLVYRPLRRAVLRATLGGGEQLYLKVLRDGAAALAARHHELAEAGVPVPDVLDASRDEVLVLRRARGDSLAAVLAAGGGFEPARLLETLDRLPDSLLGQRRRASWSERVGAYAQGARVAAPELSTRIDAVATGVERALARLDPGPLVPVHGDLYEANVFVEHGAVSGVLDLDGVGPGHRVDDLACLIAHLAVLPELDPRYIETVPDFLRRCAECFEENLRACGADPAGLWVRAAGVVLTLVAGARDELPGRAGAALGRLEIAETFLARGLTPRG